MTDEQARFVSQAEVLLRSVKNEDIQRWLLIEKELSPQDIRLLKVMLDHILHALKSAA